MINFAIRYVMKKEGPGAEREFMKAIEIPFLFPGIRLSIKVGDRRLIIMLSEEIHWNEPGPDDANVIFMTYREDSTENTIQEYPPSLQDFEGDPNWNERV